MDKDMQHGHGVAPWKWTSAMDMDMHHGHGHGYGHGLRLLLERCSRPYLRESSELRVHRHCNYNFRELQNLIITRN
jgi:hypothetical protein